MIATAVISYSDKNRFYAEVGSEVTAMMEKTWFTNLANVSAILMNHLPRINWVGFYLHDSESQALLLGPFQGLPACLKIPVGKGVCGTAARQLVTVLVDDVEKFPGHIACDARSRSEIVIPLVTSGRRLLGVLDVDSPELARFDDTDRAGLEQLVRQLVAGTEWPERFV